MKAEWKTYFRIGVTLFLLYLAIHYWDAVIGLLKLGVDAAMPLLLGAAIAYVVNILMSFYERGKIWNTENAHVKKLKRPICLLLALITIFAVIVLLVYIILPELVSCFRILLSSVPGMMDQAISWARTNINVDALTGENGYLAQLERVDWKETLERGVDLLMNGVSGVMGSIITTVTSVFSAVITFFVAIIFSIYLLIGKEKLQRQVLRMIEQYLGKKAKDKIVYVLKTVHQSFHSFIVGQCLEAMILGGLCVLGMWILRFPYASMVGTLIGFMALIPIAGAYIGAAVGAFMIFTISPMQALGFLVFLVILQQVEGNLIYPRVVGASIGLPGLWVLAAITIGGGVLGIAGMLIAVPIVASLYQLLRSDLHKREAQKIVVSADKKTERTQTNG